MRTVLSVFLAATTLLLASCGLLEGEIMWQRLPPADLFTIGEEVTVYGVMVGSRDDCVVDGNCSILLDVDGALVEAIWNEGETDRPCLGRLRDELQNGDPVTVYGQAVSSNALSICPSEFYFIQETVFTPLPPG